VYRACRVGGCRAAQELVAIGARWNVRCKEQLMAIDYAKMGHYKDIMEVYAQYEKTRLSDGGAPAPDTYTVSQKSGSFYDLKGDDDDDDDDESLDSPKAKDGHGSEDDGATKGAGTNQALAASLPGSLLPAGRVVGGVASMSSPDASPYQTDDDEEGDDRLSTLGNNTRLAGSSNSLNGELSEKEMQTRTSLILGSGLASCLSDEHVKYLALSARLCAHSARRHSEIVTEGSRKSCMWIVYIGKVRAKCRDDQTDVAINQGESFGIDELLTGRRHRRTCRALGDCQVLCISKKMMTAIISSAEMVENIAACRAASIVEERDDGDMKKELEMAAKYEQVRSPLCMYVYVYTNSRLLYVIKS
jgi:hypothetical protein